MIFFSNRIAGRSHIHTIEITGGINIGAFPSFAKPYEEFISYPMAECQ